MQYWIAQGLNWIAGFVIASVFLPTLGSTLLEADIIQKNPVQWIIAGLVIWFLLAVISKRLTPKPSYQVRYNNPKQLESSNVKRKSRRALIGLVSNYNPRFNLEPQAKETALNNNDWQTLRLPESNLAPLLNALELYRDSLEHVWLISTPQSISSARLIERYARTKGFARLQFYLGDGWMIPFPMQPQVMTDVGEMVGSATKAALFHGIDARELIVDVTGGTVPMSLAAAFACLDPKLDVQYGGFERDAAKPNVPQALLIEFEPVIKNSN
jgi:hypothetical protein